MSNQKMNEDCAGGNLLNFETTMAQFKAMFPQLSGRMIESVLRKYDGNVGQTIEELLERSATQNHSECPQSSSTTGQNRNNGEYLDEIEALKRAANRGELTNGQNCHQNHPQPSSSSSTENGTQQSRRDPCADDEKIALLIQNREFLRYLRHDPNFRQAMISQHQASANARHSSRWPLPPGPTMPPQLLLATRAARSPNTHRLFHRQNGSGKSERRVEREKPEPVPEGPIVEFAERDPALAIPEGPLIDYEVSQHDASTSSAAGWAHRIKAKLASKTGGRPPEGAEQIPPSPLVHFSDSEMQKGIQGMLARGGRGFLEGLANKFSARKQRINNGGGGRMEKDWAKMEEEGNCEKMKLATKFN